MDIPPFQSRRWGQAGLTLLAISTLVAAFTLATHEGAPLGISITWRWVGIPMMILGGGLMIYSTLIEIPLASARAVRTIQEVYTKGTYALCRHPGFLWMLIYLIGFVLVYNMTSAIWLSVCWMALELAAVAIQDQVIFPRLFTSYRAYQLTTPFVIPTLTSIKTSFFKENHD